MADLTGAVWRKSTRSNGGGGACVEVAANLPEVVGLRDSKDPDGPALAVAPATLGRCPHVERDRASFAGRLFSFGSYSYRN